MGEPTTREELAERVCLFSLPAHLCKAFWSMLEQQATRGDGDFVGFAAEVAPFLTFKLLPPPEGRRSSWCYACRAGRSTGPVCGAWST